MIKKFLTLLLTLFVTFSVAWADEGMWLPNLIGRQIPDMQSKGFRLTAEDLFSVNQASLKDAIVLFGGGCTGELVSAEGLLFTNHHCGYGQIQQHSSVEHDYLTNGFWAMSRAEELPNPGLKVSFLVRMDDVTDEVNKGIDKVMTDEEIASVRKNNIESVKGQATDGTHYKADVESLYYGNQYFLFVYEVFEDVRLVAAPPSSIGKFGGDTDNWMWPRHTGDFSVFRIYADKDNNPADYSPDNVPYRPKKHFTISTKGVQEGDFTFVYGFPGTTREYVTSDYVDYTLNYGNPHKIKLRTIRLDEIKSAQEADRAVRIKYASKQANIANGWKKWQGESLGLARLGTIQKKQEYEARFAEWTRKKENVEYAGVLNELHEIYESLLPYAFAYDYFSEAFAACELYRLVQTVLTGKATEEYVNEFFKNYEPDIDRAITKRLMREYLANAGDRFIPKEFIDALLSVEGSAVAMVGEEAEEPLSESRSVDIFFDDLFDNTMFKDRDKVLSLLMMTSEEIGKTVKNDSYIVYYTPFMTILRDEILPNYKQYNDRITELYTVYMRGQMAFEPDRNFYPDANLTLRIAYGKVEGYYDEESVHQEYMTTLDGIIAKDNPDIYDYDVPQRLRDIYAGKDYGRWGINVGTEQNPHYTVPVAFIASNHTTGGNSGSPLLNANGELLGINFDRTWLSTMSDLEFDPEICRNISVDVRYVLFVIDKVGGAGYLFDEMTLK